MQDRYIFPAVFHYEGSGGISVSFPDLPGCFTCGGTDAEAVAMAHCLHTKNAAKLLSLRRCFTLYSMEVMPCNSIM